MMEMGDGLRGRSRSRPAAPRLGHLVRLFNAPRPSSHSLPCLHPPTPHPAIANPQLAAEPYETIAFAIPAKDMVDEEEDPDSVWEHWDEDDKVYSCQLLFK
jgi:hypothetical protein